MYSSTVQQLTCRGCIRWTGKKSYWLEEGEEEGDGRSEGSSATGDRGQAATSFTPDTDGTGSGSLLDSSLSTLLKKWSSDVWVAVFPPPFIDDIIVQTAFWTTVASFMYHSMLWSCALTTNSALSDKENPLSISCIVNLFSSSVISSSSSQVSSFLCTCSHLLKFATWRFICRGLIVLCSRPSEEVQTLPEGANTHRHLCYSFLSDACLWVSYSVGQAQAVVQDWIFPCTSCDPEIHEGRGGGGGSGLICFWLTSLTRVLDIQKFCKLFY